MGAHRGQAPAAPAAWPAWRAVRPALEPQHGGAKHLARGQELVQPGFYRAEVLADRQRARPRHFGGHHAPQQLMVIPHVRALAGRHPGRYPPQPGQPHDVVQAHAAGVARRRRDQLTQRSARPGGEVTRMPRGQRPVLTPLVELVRRGADANARDDHVLMGPGVGTTRMSADR